MTSAGDERPEDRAQGTRAPQRTGAPSHTAPPHTAAPRARAAPATGRGAALLRAVPLTIVLVLAILAIGLALFGHWKRGTATIAAASGLALVLRLVVPGRYIGPLAVRSRRFDVAFLVVLTGLLTVAAVAVIGE